MFAGLLCYREYTMKEKVAEISTRTPTNAYLLEPVIDLFLLIQVTEGSYVPMVAAIKGLAR